MGDPATNQHSALQRHIVDLLDGGEARVSAAAALRGFPPAKAGVRPRGFPHSAWQLLEHLRIAQRDILRYCVDPAHESPEFPAGYWPAERAPASAAAWARSARAFLADLRAAQRLVASPATDLLAPIAHTPGVTLLEEAGILANHNSYHLGQLVQLRRALGAWPA